MKSTRAAVAAPSESLGFAWPQHPGSRRVLFTSTVVLLIFALHYDVLTMPPAIEQARGLWLQAAYLADTNFDYRTLQNEPHPEEVSPYNYPWFITSLPTLLAVMMKLLPSAQAVILTYRCLTWLCAALIGLLIYGIVRPTTGQWIGYLLIIAMLTNPVFSVQTEMLGMEIPLALFCVAAAGCLANGRISLAVLCALLATAVKFTGVISVFSILGSIFFGWVMRRPTCMRVMPSAALVTAGVLLIGLLWLSDKLHLARFSGEADTPGLALIECVCPDLALWLGLTAAVVVATSVWSGWRGDWPVEQKDTRRTNVWRLHIYCWSVVVLLLLACAVNRFLVRYIAAGVPFIFILLGISIRQKSLLMTVLLASIGWNIANRNGNWLPDLEELGPGRSAVPFLLERSREYLPDHETRLRFVRNAANCAAGRPIVTTYPYGYFLSVPRLGWVEKPAHGFSLVAHSLFYRNFKNFDFRSAQSNYIPQDSQIAAVLPYIPIGHSKEFPPAEAGDDVTFDESRTTRYVCFTKRWQQSPPPRQDLLHDWVAKSGWTALRGDEATRDAFYFRYMVLRAMEKEALALAELAALLGSTDIDAPTHAVCLEILATLGDPAVVRPICLKYLNSPGAEAFAYSACGTIALRAGDITAAGKMYEQAVALDSTDVDGLTGEGVVRMLKGELGEAERLLQRALATHPPVPKQAEAFRWLGEIRLREGRPLEAIEYFGQALSRNPRLEAARQRLEQYKSRSDRPTTRREEKHEFLGGARQARLCQPLESRRTKC